VPNGAFFCPPLGASGQALRRTAAAGIPDKSFAWAAITFKISVLIALNNPRIVPRARLQQRSAAIRGLPVADRQRDFEQ